MSCFISCSFLVGNISEKSLHINYYYYFFPEFTNPYGIQSTTQGSSKSSSEGLSQFGTARDYHDFDMQNDMLWYDEKGNGNFVTPSLGGPNFLGCPSEDKFMMSTETENQCVNPLDLKHKAEEFQLEIDIDYLDKTCLFNIPPVVGKSEVPLVDYYQVDKKNMLEKDFEGEAFVCSHRGCSMPFSNCCTGAGEFCDENPENYNYLKMEETDSNDFLGKLVEDIPYTDPHKRINKSSNYSAKGSSDQNIKEHNEPEAEANGDNIPADEILMYDTREDEYEVFDLRIIHRKNRFACILYLLKFWNYYWSGFQTIFSSKTNKRWQLFEPYWF